MKMKSIMVGLVGATALAGLSAPASAAVNISGYVSDIDYRDTDPGLVVYANPIAFPGFSLANVGDYMDFDVLTIGTDETAVNWFIGDNDDIIPYPISVTFTFTDPAGASGAPVSGTTEGILSLNPFDSCAVYYSGGCGEVDWGAPSVFSFGNGGQFSVELFDTTFATEGSANVTGRFTLLANSVPEPATWAMMIVGFGAVGGAMRRRQRKTVRYSFA